MLHHLDIARQLNIMRCTNQETDGTMASGTVKWFNPTKGYGFILPDDGSYEVYVGMDAVDESGIGLITGGQKIAYDLADYDGKSQAANLRQIQENSSVFAA